MNSNKYGTERYAISMSSKRFARYILSVCLSVRPHVALGMKRKKACLSEIQSRGREGEKALNCGTIKYIHTYICICTRDAGNRYLFTNLEMNKANAIKC